MLEIRMEDCVSRGDPSNLVSVLRAEGLTSITLTRLDQLVTKSLSDSGLSRVRVVLKSLEILSNNKENLQNLIQHGLTVKVLSWFREVHVLLVSDVSESPPLLLSLTEEFYDLFLLLGQAPLPVNQLSVVLLHLAQITLETKVHFPLRLEAIRTLNSVLESLSKEERRQIQTDSILSTTLSQMAEGVLTAGDYELQVSLSEALCRLTPRKERQQRANQWFSSHDISTAFCDIKDADFEVDCRRFLNFVNRHHGDQKRVYTFPCLRAFLDSTELFRPKDDKLDEFWIDFNLGSGCVSFFIDEPQGFLWGSIHLLREDVDHFSVQLKHHERTGVETVLCIQLNRPIMHHNSQGQTVELTFNTEHRRDLEEAAGKIFMTQKIAFHGSDSVGLVRVSLSAERQSGRSYTRKKPQSKSHLKILPLSSPSSEEDSSVIKAVGRSSAEFLFDQIRHSTPSHNSGVLELQVPKERADKFGGSISPFEKELHSSDRKRAALDSGYLSDQTEGLSACKKRVEAQAEGEESNSVIIESSPERVGPEEEEGLNEEWAGPNEEGEEPKSGLTSGITEAFNILKTHLETHFTESERSIEEEVLQSLKECQQHVSALLKAVHQQRLMLLQKFEISVKDQLKSLQESSTNLNNINAQILSFFQTEIQRLSSFCHEHLHRLETLDCGGLHMEHPNSQ